MEYKIWDKKSKINGVDASVILSNHKHFNNSDVVLFVENGTTQRIEDVNILKSVYKIDSNDIKEIAKKAYEIMQKNAIESQNESEEVI
jgi:urease accessory protein UreE